MIEEITINPTKILDNNFIYKIIDEKFIDIVILSSYKLFHKKIDEKDEELYKIIKITKNYEINPENSNIYLTICNDEGFDIYIKIEEIKTIEKKLFNKIFKYFDEKYLIDKEEIEYDVSTSDKLKIKINICYMNSMIENKFIYLYDKENNCQEITLSKKLKNLKICCIKHDIDDRIIIINNTHCYLDIVKTEIFENKEIETLEIISDYKSRIIYDIVKKLPNLKKIVYHENDFYKNIIVKNIEYVNCEFDEYTMKELLEIKYPENQEISFINCINLNKELIKLCEKNIKIKIVDF